MPARQGARRRKIEYLDSINRTQSLLYPSTRRAGVCDSCAVCVCVCDGVGGEHFFIRLDLLLLNQGFWISAKKNERPNEEKIQSLR